MNQAIQLVDRSQQPHSHLKELRKKGHVSAVIYGPQFKGTPVEVNGKQLRDALKKDPRAIIQASVADRGQFPVLVQDVQKNKLTNEWIHVDFLQIDMNEKVVTKAAIIFTGIPQGTKEGGLLQVELQEVEIRCMPDKLITTYEVDVSDLGIGGQLFVSDLPANDDVEILTDPTFMLVTVLAPRVIEAEPEEI
jgi:large subunit ribosomal protein L25